MFPSSLFRSCTYSKVAVEMDLMRETECTPGVTLGVIFSHGINT